MTPKQREAWELSQQGLSQREIGKRLGLNKNTIAQRLQGAKRYLDLDKGIASEMSNVGLQNADNLHSGWLKSETGSLYFVNKQPEQSEQNLDALLDHIADRFEALSPAAAVKTPGHTEDDLCTLYPIADAHLGMGSSEYDLETGIKRITDGVQSVVSTTPRSKLAMVLDVGDLTHADDKTYTTPKNKHTLDMSSTQYEALDGAIVALSGAIEAALLNHETVLVRILRGNHNENSYLAVMFALDQRYRNDPRVHVDKTPSDFFMTTFGENMFMAHHGDKSKAERLVMFMAHEYAREWGRSKWRYLFTGHLHHAHLRDIGGVQVEQLRAAASRDEYATSHAYAGIAQLQSITFHKKKGEVFRSKVNF